MPSVRKRLEDLEARAQAMRGHETPRYLERYFHASENARRDLHGLEPLPELPYTQEDREDDQRTLEETIPAYRKEAGWQTEEARAFLDEWEHSVEERMRR